MFKSKLMLAVAVLATGASAFAATPAPTKDQPLPLALANVVKAGLKIEKSFPAVSGLTGYVLNRDGEYSIVYATPDKKTLINGMLINAEGKNLSPDYADQYIPKPDLDGLWASAEKAPVVITGAKGAAVKSVVYAFLDPNCSFCHWAWKAFQPYQAVGLQVRWIPVAFLNATSAQKAAAMMQAEDPTAVLDKHETNYNKGGIDIQGVVVSDATRAKLDANSKLMREFGFNGTPALIYKDPKTGKVLSKNGMPRLSELPGITNLPEQPNTDDELKRFQ
jgi:thiol:disulfide interchange protein DsbG